MGRVHLTVAVGDYDHTRDLAAGVVVAPGLDLTVVNLPFEEIVFRCLKYREWDVSEMSLGAYVAMRSRGDDSLVAIPVFTSRAFRHSAFYVARESSLKELGDLAGKRVGVPVWVQTACVYARALLSHDCAIPLSDIDWYQTGVDQAGREEGTEVSIPKGVVLTRCRDRTLSDMLVNGELDALISARPPASFRAGEGRMRRLLANPAAVAEEYFGRTGIYPIMHVIVMKRSVYERYPWAAKNLLSAFSKAKELSVVRCLDAAIARFPIPLVRELAEHWAGSFGGELWPYGLERNRHTLEAFLGYSLEQGVSAKAMSCDDLFATETLYSAKS